MARVAVFEREIEEFMAVSEDAEDAEAEEPASQATGEDLLVQAWNGEAENAQAHAAHKPEPVSASTTGGQAAADQQESKVAAYDDSSSTMT